MPGEFFYWVFNMSITAAITGLVVLLLRAVPRIPRRGVWFLWLIPYARMVFPLGLNSRYSLMALISRFTTKTVTVFEPTEGVEFSMTNMVMGASGYFPITYKVNVLADLFGAAAIIWAAVFLVIVVALSASYVTALAGLRDAVLLRDNIYLSEKVRSPAVYGVFRPRIVLPPPCAEKEPEYVLAHERAHIRRADNLWRLIAFFITAIHWFNPFAWLFLKLFLADTEHACDETVIAKYDARERKEYAHALLESGERTEILASPFGGAKIRARIANILTFRRLTGLSAAGFAALLAAVFHILLTNAG